MKGLVIGVIRYILLGLLSKGAWAAYCTYNSTAIMFGIHRTMQRTQYCAGECCDTADYRCCKTRDGNSGMVAAGVVGGIICLSLLLLCFSIVCKALNTRKNRTQNITVVHTTCANTAEHRATIIQPPPYTITGPTGGYGPPPAYHSGTPPDYSGTPPAYSGTPVNSTNKPETNTNKPHWVTPETHRTNPPLCTSPPPAYYE